jgi:hypothetical protein
MDVAERSEDLLTDAVFGALRHLPYDKALSAVLARVGVAVTDEEARDCEVLLWPQVPLSGWRGKVIEPDVIVRVGSRLVVFEAKLYSPFDTSYQDPSSSAPKGLHQLAVQHHAVSAWAAGSGRRLERVVAVTAAAQRPSEDLDQAVDDAIHLGHGDVSYGWLSWHSIGAALESLDGLRQHEKVCVHDVLALMEQRGVRRVFTGFAMEDYWTVAAAQHVAAERLFPQIRTFVEELTSVLDGDAIGWSQPNWRGMWLGGTSTAVNKPREWTRGHAGAQYWPKGWPTRGKVGANLCLYAAFDFLDPALEIGLSIPGPGAAAAQSAWNKHFDALAAGLNELHGLEIVADSGELTRPTRTMEAGAVTAASLGQVAAVFVTTAHLRLRRRLDVRSLTVGDARDALLDVRDQAEACAALWSALEASGHIS